MLKDRAEKQAQLEQAEGAKREILRQLEEKYGVKSVKAAKRLAEEKLAEQEQAERDAAERFEEVQKLMGPDGESAE